MTSVPAAIFAALSPIFATRVYPSAAPDSTLPPYAIYQRIASAPENTLADGITLENDRYQIDVRSRTFAEARTLAAAARAAMLAISAPIGVVLLLEVDQYESEVKYHRVIQDYSVSQPRS